MRSALQERRKAPVTPPDTIAWRKSTRCGSNACVEVSRDGDNYLMRDSKNPRQPALRFGQAEWEDFLGGIQAGNFAEM